VILSLDDLNAPKIFRDLCMLPRGLVLVTGPTGSGKSTTLAGMVNHCNDNRPDHIITIEDPIEFVHESKRCLVNQREVHRDTLGFSEALRSALREDPDVILVGEMRDLETIRLALTAAETGHLVFGTLHTSSAAKTIDRIVDVFPGEEKDMVRSMLSESLRAVISQTLLKRIGGGRVAAHEIMIGTPAIRNLIREGKIAQMYSTIQTGQAAGMQTLALPSTFLPNTLYLGGTWNFADQYAESTGNNMVVFEYNAKNVYLVASAGNATDVSVLVDGKPISDIAGPDVTGGVATIHDERLYQLVAGKAYGDHTLELDIPEAGLRAYTFTFG
jgi:Tfp pilus assembly ATPase PilU